MFTAGLTLELHICLKKYESELIRLHVEIDSSIQLVQWLSFWAHGISKQAQEKKLIHTLLRNKHKAQDVKDQLKSTADAALEKLKTSANGSLRSSWLKLMQAESLRMLDEVEELFVPIQAAKELVQETLARLISTLSRISSYTEEFEEKSRFALETKTIVAEMDIDSIKVGLTAILRGISKMRIAFYESNMSYKPSAASSLPLRHYAAALPGDTNIFSYTINARGYVEPIGLGQHQPYLGNRWSSGSPLQQQAARYSIPMDLVRDDTDISNFIGKFNMSRRQRQINLENQSLEPSMAIYHHLE